MSSERQTATISADSNEVLARFHSELDLVRIIAAQVARSFGAHVEFDDLMSAGREGLLHAARRFDVDQGVSFRTYANYRIRGAMFDAIRRMSALPRGAYERLRALEAASQVSEGEAPNAAERERSDPRRPSEGEILDRIAAIATAAAVGALSPALRRAAQSELSEVPTDTDPEREFERAELLALLRKSIAELPSEEAQVMERHYLQDQPLEAVAAALDVSGSWARRLRTQAITRLTRRLRGLQ